jgi:hypothetical protein
LTREAAAQHISSLSHLRSRDPAEFDNLVSDLRIVEKPDGGSVFFFGLPSVLSMLNDVDEWPEHERRRMDINNLSMWFTSLLRTCPPESHARLFSCAFRVLRCHAEFSRSRTEEALRTAISFLSMFE